METREGRIVNKTRVVRPARASLDPQRDDRVDPGGAPRRQVAGDQGHAEHQERHGDVRHRVARLHLEQQAGQEPAEPERSGQPAGEAQAASHWKGMSRSQRSV